MSEVGRRYLSDLTEHQWELIKELIPEARSGGRPRTTCIRSVVDAIFYLNRSGCAWRYLPREYPPWKTVYDYFNKWQKINVWIRINDLLVKKIRVNDGREEFPSVYAIDSQTTKAHYGELRGYDGYKKMRGRKRQVLVDTLGLVHGVRIHAANLEDRRQGAELMETFEPKRRISKVIADRAYNGYFIDMVFSKFRIWTQINLNKNKDNLRPTRWVVERTFAWFNHYRRLSRDYERKTKNSESMIYLAMIQLMLRRLSPELTL
jgi:putative transposase